MNWEAQKEIWERAFSRLKARPAGASLLMTEPPVNPPQLRLLGLEVVFEELQFGSFYSAPAAVFVARQLGLTAALVLDAGYSFSHATPVYDAFPITHATRRVNMGGKALTNYLKEIVSYRQWNMMDETYLINHVKERLCYVAEDYMQELHIAQYARVSATLPTHSLCQDYTQRETRIRPA